MNIFAFEVKTQLRSIILQTFVLVALLVFLMVVTYPIYANSQAEMQKVLDGFPPEFAAAFGLSVDNIFSYAGFYSFSFLYIALVGALFSSSMTLSIFAREKRAHCSDFLLTLPLSRRRIFFEKLLACVVGVLIMSGTFVLAALFVYFLSDNTGLDLARILLSSGALFGVQLVFCAISVAAALCMRKIRSVSGVATALGFGAFILSVLPHLTGEEALRFISPLQYFDPADVFASGFYEGNYLLTALLLVGVALVGAYEYYRKSDAFSQ